MATPSALLQPEILELIFENLDGVSLWRCEHVCGTWKDVLQNYYKRGDAWRTCCKREIPEDVLLETVNRHYSSEILDNNSVNWQLVYKGWCQWLSLRSWRFVARCVFTAENRRKSIMCLRISGNCVITGHPDGSIKLWDRYKSFLGLINYHLRDVTDLDLMKYENFSVGNDEWNLKHNLVISTSIDRSIQVNCIALWTAEIANETVNTAPTTMVRAYRHIFAVLAKDSKISVWRVDGVYPSTVTLLNIVTIMEQPECINIWKGEFSGFTVSGSMFELSRNYGEDFNISFPARLGTKGGRMKKGFIWRKEIRAWLSTENDLHIALDNSSACYNTMPFLMSYPVTLLLYANIFFLGMESGEVVMYYIKTPKELTQLDLGNFQRKIKLSRDPIVALDVQETERGPCVVAATSTSLICISFLMSQNLFLEEGTS